MTRTVRPAPMPARRVGVAGVLTGVLSAVLLAGVTALPAAAHDVLLESDPGDGAVVTEPDSISLTFNNNVLPVGAVIEVSGPDGDLPAVEIEVEGPVVQRELPADLSAGEHNVTWQVTSSDGHPISGEFVFTVDAPAAPETNEGTGGTDPGDETATEDSTEDGTADSTTEDGTTDDTATEDTTTEDTTTEDTTTEDGTTDDTATEDTTTEAPASTPPPGASQGQPGEDGGLPVWTWVVAGAALIGLAGWVITLARRSGSGV